MSVLDVFYPIKCVLCGRVTNKECICPPCGKLLDRASAPKRRYIYALGREIPCYSLFAYGDENVKKLIGAVKRNNEKRLFEYLSHQMSGMIQRELVFSGGACITFVPRTKAALRHYGFDQAELLARQTASSLPDMPFRRLLCRAGSAAEQKFLDAADRERNVRGAFRIRSKDPPPRSVLLMDDVITTGNSAKACAELLLERGVSRLSCFFISETQHIETKGD